MGKRSSFERVERDFYPTPLEAVKPLCSHLPKSTSLIADFVYAEPCAGNGALINHLPGACGYASDVYPKQNWIEQKDVFDIILEDLYWVELIITNPPWDRKILHPLITHLSDMKPTWLLFDADWMHTKQSKPFLPRLKKVVSVGRIKWIPDSKMTGKDNCAWYLFDKPTENNVTEFYGRT